MQNIWQHSGKARSGWLRWAVIACALLMVVASTVQVAHAHPLTRAPERCQICHLIHSALPAESVTAPVFVGVWLAETKQYSKNLPARFETFSLSNRPPPSRLA